MFDTVVVFFEKLFDKIKSIFIVESPKNFDIPRYDDHQEDTEETPVLSADDLSRMTKKEIDFYAEQRGIKLDRRKTKQKMIDELTHYK